MNRGLPRIERRPQPERIELRLGECRLVTERILEVDPRPRCCGRLQVPGRLGRAGNLQQQGFGREPTGFRELGVESRCRGQIASQLGDLGEPQPGRIADVALGRPSEQLLEPAACFLEA